MNLAQHDNDHEDVQGLSLVKVMPYADIDPTKDKAITVRAPVAGMKPGDLVIMRPKPHHPVPMTFRAVIVQSDASGPCFLMEYDRDQIERAGLRVIAYAVGHVSATPPPSGVII